MQDIILICLKYVLNGKNINHPISIRHMCGMNVLKGYWCWKHIFNTPQH